MTYISALGFVCSFLFTGGISLLGGLSLLPSLAFAFAAGGITVITIECITLHNPDIGLCPWPVTYEHSSQPVEDPFSQTDQTSSVTSPSAPDIEQLDPPV
jgi:hypothetical protein